MLKVIVRLFQEGLLGVPGLARSTAFKQLLQVETSASGMLSSVCAGSRCFICSRNTIDQVESNKATTVQKSLWWTKTMSVMDLQQHVWMLPLKHPVLLETIPCVGC